MHWRAHSDRMQDLAVYDEPGGVVAAVRRELGERVEAIRAAGIADDRIVLDPGLGFAKRAEHNWALLRGYADLTALGYPLLVGASRKSFLGALLAGPGRHPAAGDRAGGGGARDHAAAGPAGRLGGPGARRTGHP